MKIDWKQQTVILTGAYGGLGKALAKIMHEKGAKLVLVGRNNKELEKMKDSLDSNTGMVVGDVSEPITQKHLVETMHAHKSEQHMLINNAAISHAGFLSQQTSGLIEQMMAVNLLAPIQLSQQLMPWLKQAKQAQIINIGSSFGAIGYPGFSGYCASKFGLRGFTQALNRELSDTQISAHYLAPRAMSTGINSSAVDQLNEKLGNAIDKPEEIAQQIVRSIEKQRIEKFFGWPEKLFVKINALLPNVVSNAINKNQPTIQSILNEVKS